MKHLDIESDLDEDTNPDPDKPEGGFDSFEDEIDGEDLSDPEEFEKQERERRKVYRASVSGSGIKGFAKNMRSGLETGGKFYMAAQEYRERQRAIRRNARRARWSDTISVIKFLSSLF